MTHASKLNRRSFAVIAGGLIALLTLGGGIAAADTPGGGEAPAPPPPSGGGDVQLPASGTSTITPDGQALGLGIKVELDTQQRPETFGKNFVPLIVTVTENGAPTTRDYDVFAYAQNAQGQKVDTQSCLERWYTSTTTPRGIFWCTVIVDTPGEWTHSAFVNKRRATEQEVPLNYGQAHVAIPCLEADGCKVLESTGKPDTEISGDASEVAFLSIHTIFAAAWFACIGLLVLLSLAGGRRLLSERGAHYFESKLDRVVTGTKATTLAVVGTGIYLMFRETAYNTPSTPDKLDAVFDLPYGQPYFLSLFTKIGIYAVLIAFSFVLIREARRRSTTVTTGSRKMTRDVSADDIWGGDNWEKKTQEIRGGSAGTAVMVDEPQVETETETAPEVSIDEPTHKGVRIATLVTVLGGVGIWFCVVLLKYFHQLIEAASALAGTAS